MENALLNGKLIVAFDIAKDFASENEVRKASGKKLLKCPDSGCTNPILRYCHGEKKLPYFAHLNNVDCDYAKFDKETSEVIKNVKIAIYESLKSKGVCVDMDVKILKHHYTHLLITLTNGNKLAIELGTKNVSANKTEVLSKQYAEMNIPVQWIVIDDSKTIVSEYYTYHLKRWSLNCSKNKDLIVISKDGKKATQSIIDTNTYPSPNGYSYLLNYRYYKILEKYPNVFYKETSVNELVVDDDVITIPNFHKHFKVWLEEKRRELKKEIDWIDSYKKELEEKRKQREQQAQRERERKELQQKLQKLREEQRQKEEEKLKEQLLKEQKRIELQQKLQILQKKDVDEKKTPIREDGSVLQTQPKYPVPKVGMKISHKTHGDLFVVNVDDEPYVRVRKAKEDPWSINWKTVCSNNLIEIIDNQ